MCVLSCNHTFCLVLQPHEGIARCGGTANTALFSLSHSAILFHFFSLLCLSFDFIKCINNSHGESIRIWCRKMWCNPLLIASWFFNGRTNGFPPNAVLLVSVRKPEKCWARAMEQRQKNHSTDPKIPNKYFNLKFQRKNSAPYMLMLKPAAKAMKLSCNLIFFPSLISVTSFSINDKTTNFHWKHFFLRLSSYYR